MPMTRTIHPIASESREGEVAALIVQSESLCDRRYDLKLSGPLPLDWSLRLSRDFAASGVSLLNGYARRIAPDHWTAQLEVEHGDRDFAGHDGLLRAIHSGVGPPLLEPALLRCELREATSFGGCLELEVDAWDAVGLLAAVLGCAAGVGLHPVELILETQEDCAFHHLGLKDRGRGTPSARQRRGLLRGMKRLGGL